MLDFSFFSLFLAGLLGGVHCLGMCGGIVTAMSMQQQQSKLPMLLAYNLGRIASYTLVGLLLGGLAQWGINQMAYRPLQIGLFVAANLLLVLLGLYLAGLSSWMNKIEKLGSPLWNQLRPAAMKLLHVRHPGQALLAGMLWGWLPCGLVYTASLAALASASARDGALLMLAFGLGTLPNLLLMGWFAKQLGRLKQQRPVRLIAGLAVAGMGVWQLSHLALTSLR